MVRKVIWGALVLLCLAAPAWAQPDLRPILAQLESEGYFARCQAGEMRGCSYFVRLVVYRANPNGDPNSWGALAKGGGSNVEGYADDAVALGRDAINNVYDLVASSGVPGARTYVNGPLPRRLGPNPPADVWEAPRPLSQAQMDYLKPGSSPSPTPTPTPTPQPSPSVNLQPVLDQLKVLEMLITALQNEVNGHREFMQEIAQKSIETANAARDAQRAAADTVARIDRAHNDILVVINNQKQALTCRGRVQVTRDTVLTCQP